MTVIRKKAKSVKPIPFMVYFKTKSEKDRMIAAASKSQCSPNPNLTEYARRAIRESVERDLARQ